jgi:hypothetical protein
MGFSTIVCLDRKAFKNKIDELLSEDKDLKDYYLIEFLKNLIKYKIFEDKNYLRFYNNFNNHHTFLDLDDFKEVVKEIVDKDFEDEEEEKDFPENNIIFEIRRYILKTEKPFLFATDLLLPEEEYFIPFKLCVDECCSEDLIELDEAIKEIAKILV